MKLFVRLWQTIGIIGFRLTLPGLRLFLNDTQRSRVIVECQGEILLVKPWLGSGAWMLPGGGIGKRENPARAAARELYEETAIKIQPKQLRALGSVPFNAFGLRYTNQCFYLQLAKKPQVYAEQFLEIAAMQWLPKDALPSDCSPEVHAALALLQKPARA